MSVQKILFNMQAQQTAIFKATPAIQVAGNTVRMYFVADIHNTYNILCGTVPSSLFTEACKQIPGTFFIAHSDERLAILSQSDKYKDEHVQAAIQYRLFLLRTLQSASTTKSAPTMPDYTNKSTQTAPAKPNTFSQIAQSLFARGIKENIKEPPASSVNAPAQPPSPSNPHNSPTQQAGTDKPAPPTAKACIDFSDSDETGTLTASTKKNAMHSPLEPPAPTLTRAQQVMGTQRLITAAFNGGNVIPINLFTAALCHARGHAINPKTTLCPTHGHYHPTLTRLLECFRDTVRVVTHSQGYAVSTTPEALETLSLREQTFLFCSGDRFYLLGLEMLITSLFPIRVCLSLDDLVKLLKELYPRLAAQTTNLAETIQRARLPNANAFVDKKGVPAVAISPPGQRAYRMWRPTEEHRHMEALEDRIRRIRSPGQAVKATDGVSCAQIFKAGEFKPQSIARVVDLNIPKLVQIKQNSNEMQRNCLSPVWPVVCTSVNFDEKAVFFEPSMEI